MIFSREFEVQALFPSSGVPKEPGQTAGCDPVLALYSLIISPKLSAVLQPFSCEYPAIHSHTSRGVWHLNTKARLRTGYRANIPLDCRCRVRGTWGLGTCVPFSPFLSFLEAGSRKRYVILFFFNIYIYMYIKYANRSISPLSFGVQTYPLHPSALSPTFPLCLFYLH